MPFSLIALLVLVPLSVALALLHVAPLWVFGTGAAAIIPLGGWIRRATEQVALRAGPAIDLSARREQADDPEALKAMTAEVMDVLTAMVVDLRDAYPRRWNDAG